tara:strand:- start:314 stop:619 length:306 start_codon:yes stop_codon:yes gene_type:complete
MSHPKSFNLYSDPGHAWLRVPLSEIQRFNLLSKISNYSYINNNYLYLEEDVDAPLYLDLLKENGYKPFNEYGCIKEIISNNPSQIRNYKRFSIVDFLQGVK